MTTRTRKASTPAETSTVEETAAEAQTHSSPDSDAVRLNRIEDRLSAYERTNADTAAMLAQLTTNVAKLVDANAVHIRNAEAFSAQANALADQVAKQGGRSVAPEFAGPHVLGLVLAVMRRVAEIGKTRDGKATDSASYKFRGIDDAMNAVGIAMREVGVVMRTEVVSQEYDTRAVDKVWNGKPNGTTLWTTCIARMRYIFVSPVDGSEHVLEGIGQGRDAGDKAASKALSGAMKYALFQGLCIPVTGVNVDAEESPADMADDQRPQDDASWRDQPAYGNRAEWEAAQKQRQQPATRPPRAEQPATPPAAERSEPRPPAVAAEAASPSPAAGSSATAEARSPLADANAERAASQAEVDAHKRKRALDAYKAATDRERPLTMKRMDEVVKLAVREGLLPYAPEGMSETLETLLRAVRKTLTSGGGQ